MRVGELQASEWMMNLLDLDLVLFPRRPTLPFIVQRGVSFIGKLRIEKER
jgi:hypothetical protein